MAIDDVEKRRSVTGTLGYFTGGPGVTPNASMDGDWREQVGYAYSGIDISSGPDAGPNELLRKYAGKQT